MAEAQDKVTQVIFTFLAPLTTLSTAKQKKMLWPYSYQVIEKELLDLPSGLPTEYVVHLHDMSLATGQSTSHRLQVNVTPA